MTAQSAAEVQPATSTPAAPRGASHTSLRGVQLIAARLVWLALALAVATIFVAGVPAELALLRQKFAAGTTINYKYTRGSWDSVEVDSAGHDISNRQITIADQGGSKMSVSDTVQGWKSVP